MTILTSRTAVVTAASSDPGPGIGVGLAGAGVHMLLVGRDLGRLQKAAASVPLDPRAPLIIEADFTDDAGVAAVVETPAAAFPELDVLVPAAGIYEPVPIKDTPIESLDRQWLTTCRRLPHSPSRSWPASTATAR